MLKAAAKQLEFASHILYIFLLLLSYIYCTWCIKNNTWNPAWTNLFFFLCAEFNFVYMQTKFRRSCPHHIKCWAVLVYTRTSYFDGMFAFQGAVFTWSRLWLRQALLTRTSWVRNCTLLTEAGPDAKSSV